VDKQDLLDIFNKEFSTIKGRFSIIDVSVSDAGNSKIENIWNPGVYVFFHPQRGVIRVGRSFDNARKRALQHIRDNTGGVMADLLTDPEASLILFSVNNKEDYFWAASLEVYLEKELLKMELLEIPSGRQG
jgi:hypothetical protein